MKGVSAMVGHVVVCMGATYVCLWADTALSMATLALSADDFAWPSYRLNFLIPDLRFQIFDIIMLFKKIGKFIFKTDLLSI
jgi:hypothetical protein